MPAGEQPPEAVPAAEQPPKPDSAPAKNASKKDKRKREQKEALKARDTKKREEEEEKKKKDQEEEKQPAEEARGHQRLKKAVMHFDLADELYEGAFEGGATIKEMTPALKLALEKYPLLDADFSKDYDIGKLKKIKTKQDWDFHVAPHKWYLSRAPALYFLPKANIWENAYVVFFHATKRGDIFSISNQFAVRISTMMSEAIFTDVEKHYVTNTLTYYRAVIARKDLEFKKWFHIPKKFGKFFTMVGADRSEMTVQERDLLAESPRMITGRLYGRRYYRHLEGDATQIVDQKFFTDTFFAYPDIDENTNDCLVHAVNYALRYPLFTDREQLVRLI